MVPQQTAPMVPMVPMVPSNMNTSQQHQQQNIMNVRAFLDNGCRATIRSSARPMNGLARNASNQQQPECSQAMPLSSSCTAGGAAGTSYSGRLSQPSQQMHALDGSLSRGQAGQAGRAGGNAVCKRPRGESLDLDTLSNELLEGLEEDFEVGAMASLADDALLDPLETR